MKKEPLKVGDRVAIYGFSGGGNYFCGDIGIVNHITSPGLIDVEIEEVYFTFHSNQCRKLKPKKEPRRVWADPDWVDGQNVIGPIFTRDYKEASKNPYFIEFVEVKKKKKELK